MSSSVLPPLSVDAPSQGAGPDASDTTLSPHVRRQLESAYRTEAKRLQRYLRRKTGDDAASDLVQEVFARTAASRQLTDLLHPGAYLFKVARNLLIERARTRQRHDAVFMPFDEKYDAPCPPEQVEAMEASELMQRYERALACMPEKSRRVFLMHRVDEMPYRKIAEILGISIPTVEYHMARALAHLAKRLDVKR